MMKPDSAETEDQLSYGSSRNGGPPEVAKLENRRPYQTIDLNVTVATSLIVMIEGPGKGVVLAQIFTDRYLLVGA